jgi:broad specificity phosphatase PhoE
MTLLLIRHGETALNAARVLQPADTPLSALGLRQAEAVAARVAVLAPAAILTSDLPRAWQTAGAIGAATGLTPIASSALRERDFGELRGRAYDSLGFDPLAMTAAPAGGESAAEFAARVARAFAEVLALHARGAAAGPLAIITHGLVIEALLTRHARLAPGAAVPRRLANASLSVVASTPPHAVELVGCTLHLDAAARGTGEGLHGG